MIPPSPPPRAVVLDPNANTPPYDRALCAALARAGCEVELATAPFLYEPLPPAEGYRVRHAFFRLAGGALGRRLGLVDRPAIRRLLRAAEYLPDWAALLASLERRRPDVLHVQWSLRPALDQYCWRWLRSRGVPIVYTVHNLLPHYAGAGDAVGYRRLYHAADTLIVHSRRSAAALVDRFEVPAERIAVAPHGPLLEDVPELDRQEARGRLGLPSDAPLILFAGLIEPYQGLGDLIDAFARLAASWPAARLVVAGRPNEPFEPYRRALEACRLLPRTHLDLRYLPRAELAAYLCAADAVALPYRTTWSSGLLLAAWRFGRPVVATAVGDLAELIEDGRSGLLAPPASPGALAEALGRLLADPDLASRLGEAGRRRTLTDQSWREAARRTLEVYATLRIPAAVRSGKDRD
jgi:glycosyltransferase involved in cell wall biosynthesis